MSKNKGLELQSSKKGGMVDPRTAARLSHSSMLASAKNMTAIAFADALSQAGQAWLQKMGIRINFEDWNSLEVVRQLTWNGTPAMGIGDFAEVLGLLDGYNDFDPAVVLTALWDIKTSYPGWHLAFRLAREFSPAIYIQETSHFYTFNPQEIAGIGVLLGADEAGLSGLEARFWFD